MSNENKVTKEEGNEEMPKTQVSQMFSKMADGKTAVLDARLNETAFDIMRKIRRQRQWSDSDMHLTFKGRALRGCDATGELRCERCQHSACDGVASWRRKAQGQEKPRREETSRGARV